MKRLARVLVVLVLLGALGGGAAWWFLRVEERQGPDILTLYGNIDIRHARLAFIESERIAQVDVEEGDRVRRDQVVATLRPDRLQAQISQAEAEIAAQEQVVAKLEAGTRPQEVQQAQAQVAAARIQVRNASQNLQRVKLTAGTGATSQQALDDAKDRLEGERARLKVQEMALDLAQEGPRREDIAAAKAQLEALRASLALLRVRLGDLTLLAPAPGVIESRLLEPGEMAGPASPVFTLALTDPKWARAYVPEPDLGRVQQGMKAVIQSDSFPGRRFAGWVGFISPTAEFTPKNVETSELRTKLVYEVRVFVKDPDDQLRLGMPVTVLVDQDAEAPAAGAPSDQAKP